MKKTPKTLTLSFLFCFIFSFITPDFCFGVRVLVIEDNDFVRNIAQRQLRKAGYDVTVTRTGEDGVFLYEQTLGPTSFDVVITDFNLQGVHRIEHLQQASPSFELSKIDGDQVIEQIESLSQSQPKKPFYVTISGDGNKLTRGSETFLFSDLFSRFQILPERYFISSKPFHLKMIVRNLPEPLRMDVEDLSECSPCFPNSPRFLVSPTAHSSTAASVNRVEAWHESLLEETSPLCDSCLELRDH